MQTVFDYVHVVLKIRMLLAALREDLYVYVRPSKLLLDELKHEQLPCMIVQMMHSMSNAPWTKENISETTILESPPFSLDIALTATV